jgi:arsenate reductase (thioredoxin)
VCGRAEKECPTFPGMCIREFWPFEDPAAFEGTEEERLEKFREVRDAIEARIKVWIEDHAPSA